MGLLLEKMPVHLSPKAKHELCELIAGKVDETDRKLYPTLAKAGIKGPAFYAYLNSKSVPSERVTPKLVSLALALDREEALKIIQAELEDFNKFVEELIGFTTTSMTQVNDIISAITGIGRARKKSEE